MKLFYKLVAGVFILLLVIGCTQKQEKQKDSNTSFTKAIAHVHPLQDNAISAGY